MQKLIHKRNSIVQDLSISIDQSVSNLKEKQFPLSIIKGALDKAKQLTQQTCIQTKPRTTNKTIRNILQKYWHILK